MLRHGHRGTASPQAVPGTGDWVALRNALSTHKLIRPASRTYSTAKELFDPRFDFKRPAGIAYCASPRDVTACLAFVRKFGLPVAARSGGHSYAGWSSPPGTTGLMVDVTAMNSFKVGSGQTVRVGTGLHLIDLYNRLAARGLAVPGGSCPTVGVAGLTLGGGVGVLGRAFGLTSDALESVQIVTADGTIRNCNASTNSDLFWACRGGGGGNFGIATAFTFRTHRLSRLVVFFLSWPWSQAAKVVAGWQSWAPFQPDALWSNLHMSASQRGGTPTIQVGGTYLGSVANCQRLLTGPVLPGRLRTVRAVRGRADLPAGDDARGGLREPVRVRVSSAVPDAERQAGPRPVLRQVRLLHAQDPARGHPRSRGGHRADAGSAPAPRAASARSPSTRFGGALNRPSPSSTAFVHRDSLFGAQYSTSWNAGGSASGVSRQHAWLRSYYASMRPWASGQCYQNYVDPDLTNWQQAYYGANYPRLARIKKTYDPHQVFKFPQGITPA